MRVADACVNTLWNFREALVAAGALDKLFGRLDQTIKDAGNVPMLGQIVDASLVAAPRQRNTEEENVAIEAGQKAAEIWPDRGCWISVLGPLSSGQDKTVFEQNSEL